jgi:DNA-binding transcriptional MerR regulator
VEKAPDAFLTIGEMADRLGVKTHILRYWEEQFPMLNPLKRAGGRRLYRPGDVALLEQISDLLGKQGYTIRGARSFLAKKTTAEAAPAPTEPQKLATASADLFARPATPDIAPQLQAIRHRLATALAAS